MWLDRDGYDKIARQIHHSPQAIKRYVSTFLRLAVLHREGKATKEIAFLTQSSPHLVADYLTVYQSTLQNETRRAKMEEEIQRVSGWDTSAGSSEVAKAAEKGGQKACVERMSTPALKNAASKLP
jgi:hypothetical protein